MQMLEIVELQMLAEHLKYLRDKCSSKANDKLIKHTEDAYIRLVKQIGSEE